jgi:hypothetical protein
LRHVLVRLYMCQEIFALKSPAAASEGIDRLQNDLQHSRDRIRSTKTKKTSCEFSILGVLVDDHH